MIYMFMYVDLLIWKRKKVSQVSELCAYEMV